MLVKNVAIVYNLIKDGGAKATQDGIHSIWMFSAHDQILTFRLCKNQLHESIFLGFGDGKNKNARVIWSLKDGLSVDGSMICGDTSIENMPKPINHLSDTPAGITTIEIIDPSRSHEGDEQ